MLTRPRKPALLFLNERPVSLLTKKGSPMKRAFNALAVLVASLLLPLSAAASEAWILDIPVRGIANQETGMARVTLELSAAPAGSQLVVGSTTLNLGDSATVAGDSVTYEALTGNNVRITYVPKSN